MALSLYLDDCAGAHPLTNALRRAGHTVLRPAEVGLAGVSDPQHFAYAQAHHLIILTKNPGDFRALHDVDPNHLGIFLVYQDNDPTRDMSDPDIVRAISNLEQAGVPLAGECHSLNDWRY